MLKRGVAVFWVMGADPGHEFSNGPLQRVEVNIWLHDVIDADVFSHRPPPFIPITYSAARRIRLPTRQAIALAMQIQAHETFREVFDVKAKPMGMTWEQFTQGYIAKTSHTQRVMMIEEPANMAVFIA